MKIIGFLFGWVGKAFHYLFGNLPAQQRKLIAVSLWAVFATGVATVYVASMYLRSKKSPVRTYENGRPMPPPEVSGAK